MAEFRTTIDIAGGRHGGAARFLAELDRVVDSYPDVQVIGRPNSLTPRWLVERELRARGSRRIALNNASFVTGADRVVLLRNALHFSDEEEFASLNFVPTKELRAQIPVIRALSARASKIVVPCTNMKERVLRHTKISEDRIVVRFHPVGQLERVPAEDPQAILMPIVNSPYKQLEKHVTALLGAISASGEDSRLLLTGSPDDYSDTVSEDPRVEFLGVLPSDQLAEYWKSVTAVYFPTTTEAFGYPLAEARVHGVPVIAVNTEQNHEIAAGALKPYQLDDQNSLAAAVTAAFREPVVPEPAPFDPETYFAWLLEEAR